MDTLSLPSTRKIRKGLKVPGSSSSLAPPSSPAVDPASIVLPSPAPNTPGEDIFHTSVQVPTLSTLSTAKDPKNDDRPSPTSSVSNARDAAAFHSVGPYFPDPPAKAAVSSRSGAMGQLPGQAEDSGAPRSLSLPETNFESPANTSSLLPKSKSLDGMTLVLPTPKVQADLTPVAPIPHAEPGAEANDKAQADGESLSLKGSDPETSICRDDILEKVTDMVILIGISGSPASGKSTLLNMLKLILPSADIIFCVYQDDFEFPGSTAGTSSGEHVDWESLTWILKYAKRNGRLPPHYATKHDEQEEKKIAIGNINIGVVEELFASLDRSRYFSRVTVGLIDGSLLFHDSAIKRLLDIKLFMRIDERAALARKLSQREESDPEQREAYELTFKSEVWPAYVKAYSHLFRNNDVEDEVNLDIMEGLNIIPQPALSARIQATQGIEANLRWAHKEILLAMRHIRIEQMLNEKVARNCGRYKPCDCQDGWLGKVRKVIYDFV